MTNMRMGDAVATGTGLATTPEEIAALRNAVDEADLIELPDNFDQLPLQERWDLLGVKFTMQATGVVTPPNEKE